MNLTYKQCNNSRDSISDIIFDNKSDIIYIVNLDGEEIKYSCYNSTSLIKKLKTLHEEDEEDEEESSHWYIYINSKAIKCVELFNKTIIKLNFNRHMLSEHKLFTLNNIGNHHLWDGAVNYVFDFDIYEFVPIKYDFLKVSDDEKIYILSNVDILTTYTLSYTLPYNNKLNYKQCSNESDIISIKDFDEFDDICYIISKQNNKTHYFCFDVDSLENLINNYPQDSILYNWTGPENSLVGAELNGPQYIKFRAYIEIVIINNFDVNLLYKHKLFYFNFIEKKRIGSDTLTYSSINAFHGRTTDIYEIIPIKYNFLDYDDIDKLKILNDTDLIKLYKLSPYIDIPKLYINYIKLDFNILKWIPTNKLNYDILCSNEKAINFLEPYLSTNTNINWFKLCANPNAYHIIEAIYNSDPNDIRLKWDYISLNINALKILGDNYYMINWNNLSKNNRAINILKYDYNFGFGNNINWFNISANSGATTILQKELTRTPNRVNDNELSSNKYVDILFLNTKIINWGILSANHHAYSLLLQESKKPRNKLKWGELCKNTNPYVIKNIVLNDKLNKKGSLINWDNLCANKGANVILEQMYFSNKNNPLLNWDQLSTNINAGKILYDDFKTNNGNKLNWNNISLNEGFIVIKILKEEYESNNSSNRINWDNISSNSGIFNLKI